MSKLRKQILICNLYQYENTLDNSILGIKSEYLSSNPLENCNELTFHTIDFIALDNMIKGIKDFIPHYLFCIYF